MDDKVNVLAASKRRSRYAVLSASVAALTLVCVVLSFAAYSQGYARAAQFIAFGQLTFPVSIVAGHLGRRQIARRPSAYSGGHAATFGLMVGYLNLMVVAVIFAMAISGGTN